MEDKNKVFNRAKVVNRFALIIITIIGMFLFVGYVGDFKDGNITFGFMLAVIITVFITMIVDYVVFFIKKDSQIFKYISVVGYMCVYALAVFGAQNDSVYVMAFPLTVIYILYYDYALVMRIAIVFGVINVADA